MLDQKLSLGALFVAVDAGLYAAAVSEGNNRWSHIVQSLVVAIIDAGGIFFDTGYDTVMRQGGAFLKGAVA